MAVSHWLFVDVKPALFKSGVEWSFESFSKFASASHCDGTRLGKVVLVWTMGAPLCEGVIFGVLGFLSCEGFSVRPSHQVFSLCPGFKVAKDGALKGSRPFWLHEGSGRRLPRATGGRLPASGLLGPLAQGHSVEIGRKKESF